jgi:hypothetical protein
VQDPIPTRPADLASTSLRDLIAGHEPHITPLVNTRLGVGAPEPVGRLRADALDALVCRQALSDPLTAMGLVTVAEALAYGAPVPHLAAGLRSWADGQHQHASMSAAAHDEVHALLDDQEVSR